MWQKTVTDMLGRTVRTEKPGFGGTVEVVENFYNDKGQLVKTTVTGMVATLYVYDELGNQVRSGLDVDSNDTLVLASADRITDTSSTYDFTEDAWWQKSEQQIYATENSATATTVSTQLSCLTGFGEGGLMRENVSIDMLGNRVVSRSVINRDAQTETSTVDYPDSTIDAVATTVGGLLISSKDKNGITMTYAYDALGRRTGVIDPRTGTSQTAYTPAGRLDWEQDAAGNRTVFGYDAQTGKKILETNPDTTTIRYSYNNQGQITHQWGSATYPVSYEYDGYGRLERMQTYRGGSGFDAETFPADVSGDETRWIFDEATGLLSAKQDAEGKQVTYSYAAGSKLQIRSWARDSGAVVTTYSYDPATGELVTIDYSDDTPDVQFGYDRLGRQKGVSDAVGSRTFGYNSSLQLETETLAGLISETITRSYDGLGRGAGFSLGAGYGVTYGYDNTGRFNTVGWTAEGLSGNAAYAYLPNSNLLQGITTDSGLVTTYSYEPYRNLRTQIKNEYDTSVISQYDYAYDSMGRRTSVKNAGSAFSQSAFNSYNYNDRSELTGSSRYNGTDITDTTNPVNVEARTYDYDNIGNRESATEALTNQITYDPNPLNQYTQITTDEGTPVTEIPAYDEDGNLTDYDGKVYTWNAENRLVVVEPETAVDGDTKVEYVYDFMGRRVSKQVSNYADGFWAVSGDTRFLYDGWNLVHEIVNPDTAPNTVAYVWGLDLSGTLQGAGGIGGLLTRVKDTDTHLYTFGSNGNVGQLINAADGSIVAHYEYDSFGNITSATGIFAADNPFRFSTKYYDQETGRYYYGYRYYSPELGRWLSRDPIGEEGGINLYGFVNNNAVNLWDILGEWVHPNGIISPEDASSTVRRIEAKHIKNYNSSLQNSWLKRAMKGFRRYDSTLRLLYEIGSVQYNTANTDGSTNKWIFTCGNGWIDLGHFFNSAFTSTLISNDYLTYLGTVGIEFGQLSILPFDENSSNAQSAGTAEDLNSNYQGAYLAHVGIGNISYSFTSFLKSSGAVKITDNEVMGILQRDAASLLSGDTYTGERSFTRQGQLDYQRKNQEAFCKLCDGNEAKPEYRY